VSDPSSASSSPGWFHTRIMRSILWYQRATEGRPSPCRFFPSCSSYALEAVDQHGTRRGLLLATRRLLRCRPFGPSGFDPVPDPAPRQEV
jgi:putative membrane protein insertion efficiency factor